MAMLIVTEGPASEQKFSLAGARLTMIGRDAGCSFQILDPELSRNHLQIRFAEDQARHFAKDFDSSNGVFVNGKKIEGETALSDGDAITIGKTTIVYSTADAADAQRVFDAWKKGGQAHLRTITPQ